MKIQPGLRLFKTRKCPSAMHVLPLSLLAALAAVPLFGADDGGGRSVFATGAGNRALSLGGAYVAVADDPSAVIWNPAGLGLLQRKELQVTQTQLFGMGFSEQYASIALPNWRWGAVSMTWRRFSVGGIEGRDERGFLVGGDLRDAETELLVGYGRSLLDGNLSLGGAFKIRHHKLADHADSGLGLDLGIWMRPLSLSGSGGRFLTAGLAVRNLMEPHIRLADDNVPDPIALRAGAAVTQNLSQRLRLLVLADLEQTRGMDGRLHAGIEVSLEDVLALRIGSAAGSLTAGTGLSWQNLNIDYQFEDNALGSIHRFGIGISFGPTIEQSKRRAHAAAEAVIQQRLEAAFNSRNDERELQILNKAQQELAHSRWDNALASLGTLQVLAPESPDLPHLMAEAWMGQARQLEQSDDLAGAALSLRRALAVWPDHADAVAELSRVQEQSDHRALRSREIRSRWAESLDALAAEELTVARNGFMAILSLSPEDRDAARMLEYTERALTQRATASALASIEIPSQPPKTAPAVERGSDGRDLVEPALSTSATSSPPSEELSPTRRREISEFYRRGLEAMQADRRAEAVQFWEIVWNTDPDHEHVREYLTREYLARGMEEFAAGALRQAVTSWEQAVRIDPDDPRARGYLQRALQQLARVEQIAGGH